MCVTCVTSAKNARVSAGLRGDALPPKCVTCVTQCVTPHRLWMPLPALLAKLKRGEDVTPDLREARERMRATEPARAHGANRYTTADEGKDSRGSDRTSRSRGETATYLAARIKRDHPEIAEQVEDGLFKSMRQAAIAAGIIKLPTKLETVKKAVSKLNADKLAQFCA